MTSCGADDGVERAMCAASRSALEEAPTKFIPSFPSSACVTSSSFVVAGLPSCSSERSSICFSASAVAIPFRDQDAVLAGDTLVQARQGSVCASLAQVGRQAHPAPRVSREKERHYQLPPRPPLEEEAHQIPGVRKAAGPSTTTSTTTRTTTNKVTSTSTNTTSTTTTTRGTRKDTSRSTATNTDRSTTPLFPEDLRILTWNVKGKAAVSDVEEAFATEVKTWDILMVQEVSQQRTSTSSGHIHYRGAIGIGHSPPPACLQGREMEWRSVSVLDHSNRR